MEICKYQGNGVCINCKRIPPKGYGDTCRERAQMLLDCLIEITATDLTEEQKEIFEDFGVDIKEVE